MRSSESSHRRIGKLTTSELHELARDDDDASVRAHAAIVLGDDALLAEAVAPQTGSWRTQMWDGVQQIASAQVLYVISQVVNDSELLKLVTQRAARAASPAELRDWLARNTDSRFRETLVSSVALGRTVKSDIVPWVAILEDLALSDVQPGVRLAAAWRLRSLEASDSALRVLARSDDPRVRVAITDESLPQEALIAVASKDPVDAVRVAALNSIALQTEEPGGLVELAKHPSKETAVAAANALKRRSSIQRVLDSADANPEAVDALKARPGWRSLVSLPVHSDPTIHVYVFPPWFSDFSFLMQMEEIGGSNFFTDMGLRRSYLRGEDDRSGMYASLRTETGQTTLELLWHPRGFAYAVFTDVAGGFSKRAPDIAIGTAHLTLIMLGQPTVKSPDDDYVQEFPAFGEEDTETIYHYNSGGIRRLIMRAFELRIFASYARSDLSIVKLATSFNRSLPMLRFEYDLEVLTAGDIWEQEVEAKIRRATIFQLFWSPAAASSANVEKEWRFALSLKRKNFVCPVYWGSPGPEPKPPEELEKIHFNRLDLPVASPR